MIIALSCTTTYPTQLQHSVYRHHSLFRALSVDKSWQDEREMKYREVTHDAPSRRRLTPDWERKRREDNMILKNDEKGFITNVSERVPYQRICPVRPAISLQSQVFVYPELGARDMCVFFREENSGFVE